MIEALPPGAVLIVGGLMSALLRGRAQSIFLLLLPVIGLWHLIELPNGDYHQLTLFGLTLTPVRVDKLSLLFGYVFHIAAFLAALYAWHLRDTVQHVAAMGYAGAAVGAAFAGDLVTLFVYWELTAVTSVFLIWASRTERSYRAGLRYLMIQVGSGVILLGGIAMRVQETGSAAFGHIGLDGLPGALILLAIGIKCAFPLLHNWLQDAYPESTVTGAVYLSVFTTKLAVYALARGYAGTEMLMWIGAVMTVFPVFFAVIENDLRKVLSYSLNNQLGFMVCGIGIGTQLAVDGAVAHAFVHIIYKALLFMAMGAVLFRTGTVKASALGGLYKSMPWSAGFCIVGSASISAFPLFSGFVAKSLIMAAAAQEGQWVVWIMLLFASAGVLDHSGIKVPYFSFFAHDSGIRVKEAPFNMLLAMALAAALCITIGVYPGPLYALLPYAVFFDPYTAGHVIAQSQLLLFAMLAFAILMRAGLYPPELPSVNLDFDWIYRRALPAAARVAVAVLSAGRRWAAVQVGWMIDRFMVLVLQYSGPEGVFARTWPVGSAAIWVLVLLAGLLIVYYL
jgi:multicomponent Na+:H+ antiporter subunit D